LKTKEISGIEFFGWWSGFSGYELEEGGIRERETFEITMECV
jgi:hypothetical protein